MGFAWDCDDVDMDFECSHERKPCEPVGGSLIPCRWLELSYFEFQGFYADGGPVAATCTVQYSTVQ